MKTLSSEKSVCLKILQESKMNFLSFELSCGCCWSWLFLCDSSALTVSTLASLSMQSLKSGWTKTILRSLTKYFFICVFGLDSNNTTTLVGALLETYSIHFVILLLFFFPYFLFVNISSTINNMRTFARSIKSQIRSCPSLYMNNSTNVVLNANNSRLFTSLCSSEMRRSQAYLLSHSSKFCTTKEGEAKVDDSAEKSEKVNEEPATPDAPPKPEGLQ